MFCQKFLCGLGKGNFKMFKMDGSDELTGSVSFKFTNDEDSVVLNGVVVQLRQVLADQRKQKPDAGMCYHNVELGEYPSTFKI